MKKIFKHISVSSTAFFIISLFIFAPTVSATTVYDICTVTLEETNSSTVELTWNAIEGAETYEIYRAQNEDTLFKTQNEINYNKIATTQDTSYLDESVSADTKYTYYVLPLDKTGSANWGYETATVTVHTAYDHFVDLMISMFFCFAVIFVGIVAIIYVKRARNNTPMRKELSNDDIHNRRLSRRLHPFFDQKLPRAKVHDKRRLCHRLR